MSHESHAPRQHFPHCGWQVGKIIKESPEQELRALSIQAHRSEKHKNQWGKWKTTADRRRRRVGGFFLLFFIVFFFFVQRNKFTTFAVDVGVFRQSIFRLPMVYSVLVRFGVTLHPHETEVRTLVECATPKGWMNVRAGGGSCGRL